MAGVNELLQLHQYKLSQQQGGMDSFADALNAEVEDRYKKKKKEDRQEVLMKKIKDAGGDMKREISLDDDGKITAKFSDKTKTDKESRSYDKDVWKRAKDIAKATYAESNPYDVDTYTPSMEEIIKAVPAAQAMFGGAYPSIAQPDPTVTPDPGLTTTTPAQGQQGQQVPGNLLTAMAGGPVAGIGQLMGQFGQQPQVQPQQPVQAAPVVDQGMPGADVQQQMQQQATLAIKELEKAGYPVTEENIKAVMEQMSAK